MKQRKGYNSTRTKSRNRGITLRLIAEEHQSRTDISRKIGLTKMAVTKIVGELIEKGYVAEGETTLGQSVGRTPTYLEISADAPLGIGLSIGRNALETVVCSLTHDRLFGQSTQLSEKENAETIRDKAFYLLDKAIEYTAANYPRNMIIGIGISTIGPLDPRSGEILNPTNFYSISDFPIGKLVEKRYDLPVFMQNDMNSSALVEKLYGIGKKYDSFMYMGLTAGIGSGIIIDGRLCQSDSKTVGEIGHMSLNFEGPVCSCGNRGCLEAYANIPKLTGLLSARMGRKITPEEFSECDENDACRKIFDDVADRLSYAIVNSVNFLDLDCIIIGHEGSYLPDRIFTKIEDYTNGHILAHGHKKISVCRSTFANDAPVLGSVCILFDKLFEGEI